MKNLFEIQIPIVHAGAYLRYMPRTDSTKIIKKIKYKKGEYLAQMMGEMMAQEYSFLSEIDVIIPTPLTRSRQRERGYNQSEELAKGITKLYGKPIDTSAVKRCRFSESQTKVGKQNRQDNVSGVFECVHPERLNGKHILLVDDVVTTGATLLSLAQSIMKETTDVRFSILSLCITGETRHL